MVQPDLVLLDVVMPGMQGFEVCQILKADPLLADVPVIFTTGLGDTEDDIRNRIGQRQIPHERSTVSPFVTISIGIATARSHPDMTPESWTNVADAALYKAKAAGRNQIRAEQFEAA